MAERARFEIYPERYTAGWMPRNSRKPSVTGRYCWRFVISEDVICSSDRSFAGRELANGDIHEFIEAIHSAECGIHPDIIDVEEA